ncbi:uncharacterized protein TNCV_4127861 [Trichonephila clavipes]|uniref:Endonuclease/exonuclease/phosphatase domain-containing protein n=1 Tax=Trichonephila clavipes TaxID=2585209 RepID=A0A8X6VMV5_TRICX|nr:uncharacterized protein TNCV_4127861 [Trichonephila clavipes]
MIQLLSPKDPGDGKLLKLWMPWTQTLILLTRITSQAVAVRIHSTSLITVCCLYLPPNTVIHQHDLNNLVDQLPTPFVILGDFNGHSSLWGSAKTNLRGRQIEQEYGEPKSIKKLRSGDLLIETTSALQSKSFLLAKTILDFLLTVTPHKSLNSCRGVISEPDLLSSSESKVLEELSDQGVTQVRRITIKKNSSLFPTKNLILTFNSPKLPSAIKAGYLNSKVRPYIPNPLRCFKCQSFGHSQTSCRGQKKNPVKNTSVKIATEQDSPNDSTPVSKRSRRRKTSKTLDAMDTDVDPSDTDYVTGLASEED